MVYQVGFHGDPDRNVRDRRQGLNGLFRHGDLMDVLGVPAKQFHGIFNWDWHSERPPHLGAPASTWDSMPYYFTADAGGEFGFTVEVINEVFIGLENGKAGVNFKAVISTGSELTVACRQPCKSAQRSARIHRRSLRVVYLHWAPYWRSTGLPTRL